MLYLMKPLDDFFFRTPAPFEAGGETVSMDSMELPLPSVYAGAFRHLFGLKQKKTGKLRIGFNGFAWDEKCLFPMPADLYWAGDGANENTGLLRPMGLISKPVSSYPLDYNFYKPESAETKDKKKRKVYLKKPALEAYLKAEGASYEGLDLNHGSLVRDRKIGIGMDRKSHTAREGQLYQISGVRPGMKSPLEWAVQVQLRQPRNTADGEYQNTADEDYRNAAAVPGKMEYSTGVLKLGGEGKMAVFNGREEELHVIPAESDARYFKLYLATPAIFEKGWFPGWLKEETMEGIFTHKKKSVRLKLIGACVGRGIPCGGFGFHPEEKEYLPRELRYAVPAGSVYYFRILHGTFQDAVKLFHEKCISDYRESKGFQHEQYNKYRYCDRGFGYAMVGRLSKEQEDNLDGQ